MKFLDELERLKDAAWPRPWRYVSGWIEAISVTDRHRHFARSDKENADLIVYLVNHADEIAELVKAADGAYNGWKNGGDVAGPMYRLRDALANLNKEKS